MDISGKSLSKEKKNMLLFMMLVQQYEKIARMNLGETPNPVHNQKEEDLKAARFAVDTLDMLKDYTSSNLNTEAREYIESLHKELSETLAAKEKEAESREKQSENNEEAGSD